MTRLLLIGSAALALAAFAALVSGSKAPTLAEEAVVEPIEWCAIDVPGFGYVEGSGQSVVNDNNVHIACHGTIGPFETPPKRAVVFLGDGKSQCWFDLPWEPGYGWTTNWRATVTPSGVVNFQCHARLSALVYEPWD